MNKTKINENCIFVKNNELEYFVLDGERYLPDKIHLMMVEKINELESLSDDSNLVKEVLEEKLEIINKITDNDIMKIEVPPQKSVCIHELFQVRYSGYLSTALYKCKKCNHVQSWPERRNP